MSLADELRRRSQALKNAAERQHAALVHRQVVGLCKRVKAAGFDPKSADDVARFVAEQEIATTSSQRKAGRPPEVPLEKLALVVAAAESRGRAYAEQAFELSANQVAKAPKKFIEAIERQFPDVGDDDRHALETAIVDEAHGLLAEASHAELAAETQPEYQRSRVA